MIFYSRSYTDLIQLETEIDRIVQRDVVSHEYEDLADWQRSVASQDDAPGNGPDVQRVVTI